MQTIDVSFRIAGDICFGSIERVTPDLPWSYRGDTEQCDRCGHEVFTVVADPDGVGVLATHTGQALRCADCYTTYPLRCEE